MRMTQFTGLSLKAKKYLEDRCKKDLIEVFRNGDLEKSYMEPVKTKGDIIFGMFEEEIRLYSYELTNGSIVREVEQASPWSSGPVIFTCLEDGQGKKIGEWTDREIKDIVAY
jgi:hypothetical protein